MAPECVCCRKWPVEEMAPMVESLSQLALAWMIGVWPRTDQVRITVGFRLKPLSSRKTRVAPCSTFFFQLGERLLNPSLNRLLIAFQGTPFWLLRTEPELVKELPDVIGVVPHVEENPDDLPHAGGRPAIIGIPERQRSCTQHVSQLSALFWTQACRRPSSSGGLEAPSLTETLFPGPNRTFGNADRFRNGLGTDLAGGQELLGIQPPFFQLITGQGRGSPHAEHVPSLPLVSNLCRSQ